ncbi:reverse transcriptase domain-containing protein [Tanacetum coccineum]
MMNSFFQMNTASTLSTGSLHSNTVANPRGELEAITTQSGLVLDGPSVPMPPPFINPEEDERVEETLTDPELAEYTIKKKRQEKDEVQIHKDEVQIHKSLLSNKEKFLELSNTPLNENCSAIILKKLPEKLGDPGKFLIPCGFSELRCKALADLGASINLMPLSVWKKLGLPELISIRMTLELANRTICTLGRIARDVFVLVGKFTFPADFVIVDYESDPRVPLILGRPFLRTARALIDVHGEEMILRDGDERLILNMRNDTSRYSNTPQKESINMIDIYNISHKEYLEDLFANEKITNHPSGNPTSYLTSHTDLTSPEVNDDIFDPEGDIIENLLNLDKTKDLPPYHDNPLSGSTTSSSPSLPISETSDYFLEEFADELAHFAFPPGIDYLPFDIKSDLREIEYLLNHDPIEEMDSILEDSVDKNSPDDNLVDTLSPHLFWSIVLNSEKEKIHLVSPSLRIFNVCGVGTQPPPHNTHPPTQPRIDYLPFDIKTDLREIEYLLNHDPIEEMDYILEDSVDKNSPDDNLMIMMMNFFDLESDNDDVYDDPFDSKEDKIKESKLLIDELDPPRSSDFLPSPKCDSVFYENFSKVDTLSLTNNEDKDFNPPLYELLFHKEVPGSEILLSFSSENEEKVFNPGILTSKGVHTSLLPELSHRGPKAFKVIKNFESLMEIFPCSYGKDIHVLDVLCLHFYPP